jgi:hypothetical protein
MRSASLLPFFEEYAIEVFNAEAREHMAVIQNESSVDGKCWLQLADDVLQRIVAKSDGVWPRTVEEVCEGLGLGSRQSRAWVTDSGAEVYSVAKLMRPCEKEIRLVLRIRAQGCQSEEWELLGRRVDQDTPSKKTDVPSERDEFIKAVKNRLKDARGRETVKQFAKRLSTNETVLYRLQKGVRRCSAEALEKIAKQIGCSSAELYREGFDHTIKQKK